MLKTPDGVSLRTVRWPPPPGRKGTVCLFQGRAEFIEKYFETVRDLHARGFAVATLDWRGQGLSDRALSDSTQGLRAKISRNSTPDLSTFMKEIVLPDCPPPFFALAHSMGSAMLLRAAARNERWFDRMVFTAPLIRIVRAPFGPLAPAVARTLRLFGLGSMYVPGARALSPARCRLSAIFSPPIRCAMRAPWRSSTRSRIWRSVRRQWRGPTRPSGRWRNLPSLAMPAAFASQF